MLTDSAGLADSSALPAWLTSNPTTRTFTGMPDDAQVDTIGVHVGAVDPRNAIGSETFNLTIAITNVNEVPTVQPAVRSHMGSGH